MVEQSNNQPFSLNKTVVQQQNLAILKNFKHQKCDPSHPFQILPLMATGKTPFRVDTGYYDLYLKETVELSDHSYIDFIHLVENVSQKELSRLINEKSDPDSPLGCITHQMHAELKGRAKFDSFVWNSNAEGMRQAVRGNLLKTEALTSQLIYLLGKYHAKTTERAMEGIISNKYDEKILLVDLCQDRVELLQPIERLINNYNEYATPAENLENIQAIFWEYIVSVGNLIEKLDERFSKTQFEKYDKNAKEVLRKALIADQERAKEFISHIKPLKHHQSNAAHLVHTIRQTQNLNQNITYSRSSEYALLRGDLNNYLEDAIKQIHDYVTDPHNPITKKHQGIFTEGKRIWFDSNEQNLYTSDELKTALKKISTIEQKNKIIKKQDKEGNLEIYLESKYGKFKLDSPLKQTYATKWGSAGTNTVKLKKALAWIGNMVIGVPLGLLDLGIGLVAGIVGKDFASLTILSKIEIENPIEATSYPSLLWAKVDYEEMSLGTKVGKLLARFLKNITVELIKGIGKAFQDWYFVLRVDIYGDFLEGWFYNEYYSEDYEKKSKEALKNFDEEMTKIIEKEQQEAEQVNHFVSSHYPHAVRSCSGLGDDAESALPDYHRNDKSMNDLANSCATGWHEFGELFLQEIFAKHPFAGVIFLTTYTAAGLAVMAPASVSFLSPKYIAFSQAFGATFAKSTTSSAIASAFTQAKIAIGIYEAFLHGPKSWLGTLADILEKDPSTGVAYTGLALLIGHLLAFECGLPFLSEYLREDCGKFKPFELTFAGGKLVVVLFELIREEHVSHELAESYRGKLEDAIGEIYAQKVQSGELNANQKQKIGDFVKKIVSNRHTLTQLVEENTNAETIQERNNHLEKIRLLMRLSVHKEKLSRLSYTTKHFLSNKIKDHFHEKAEAFESWFYPESSQSIIKTTLRIILGYIPAIFRALLSLVLMPIFSPRQAWGDLGIKIRNDLTRAYHAAIHFTRTMYGGFSRLARTFADIFLNEIVARIEGYIRDNQHTIATEFTYPASAKACESYEKTCEVLGNVSGIYALEKAFFPPNPEAVILQLQNNEHFWKPVLTEIKSEQVEEVLNSNSVPTQPISSLVT